MEQPLSDKEMAREGAAAKLARVAIVATGLAGLALAGKATKELVAMPIRENHTNAALEVCADGLGLAAFALSVAAWRLVGSIQRRRQQLRGELLTP